MEQLKPKDIWTVTSSPTSPTTLPPVKIDQRIVEAGSHVCKVPKDVGAQLLCTYFLYNNIQTHCTFRRFGNVLGMCDYTPEGYTNVVKFNANAREKRGKR